MIHSTLAIAMPLLSLVWGIFFCVKVLRPAMALSGMNAWDVMMGLGLLLGVMAICAIPILLGIRLHLIVMVGLGLLVFRVWFRLIR